MTTTETNRYYGNSNQDNADQNGGHIRLLHTSCVKYVSAVVEYLYGNDNTCQ